MKRPLRLLLSANVCTSAKPGPPSVCPGWGGQGCARPEGQRTRVHAPPRNWSAAPLGPKTVKSAGRGSGRADDPGSSPSSAAGGHLPSGPQSPYWNGGLEGGVDEMAPQALPGLVFYGFVRGTTDRNHLPWPGKIVATCMSYFTTGGPGKERGTNKLPPMGRIRERSKGEKRHQSICPANLPESFSLESIMAE